MTDPLGGLRRAGAEHDASAQTTPNDPGIGASGAPGFTLADIFDAFHGPTALENATSRDNGRRRPRGYAAWRPQRKTRVLLGQVEEILDEYRDHLPLTVRQVFYRLVAAHGYEKTERAYARLSEHVVRARRARLIPFDHIRDDGVTTISMEWFGSPEDFWDDAVQRGRRYRRDRQAGQPQRIELWCEAAGMAPQLARVADEFSVPVFSAGGFASLTAVRQIVDRAVAPDRTCPTVLLHVGDFDPSGESIFEAMVADAQAFVEADRITAGIERVEGLRVALTADQVEAHELPTAPAKKTDSRTVRWRGETCQLEALPPDVLARAVREAIAGGDAPGIFENQVEQEEADRRAILRALPAGGGE